MDLREAFIRLSNIHTKLEEILTPERLTELDSLLFDIGRAANLEEEKAKAPKPGCIGEPKSSPVLTRLTNPTGPRSNTPTHWMAQTSEGDSFDVEVFGPGMTLNVGIWVIAHKLNTGRWVTYSV